MSKILLVGSDEAITQMICNAINASEPRGLGFLHYKPVDVKPADLGDIVKAATAAISVDYFQGRMVKLTMWRDEGNWTVNSLFPPRPDYQSWCYAYPTWEALAASAGVIATVVPDAEEIER